MTPEEWARVRDIFDSALAQNADDRDAFLERECAGNLGLRDELASLLAALDGADDFIESPAFEVAADLFVEDPGPSLSGTRVGPYLVRHEIGRGGMGVVYLADDTRLSRRVALKAILPEFQSDSGRRERLRQEARAAAALSHPGIATVYAIEEIDNQLYLASEYVAGPTLRAIIEAGPMPPGLVLDVATQLAHALAAAHAQGVVHRDLKPENIVRTASGAIKVLDFGVARIENVGGNSASHRLTADDAALGTPAYMSPEQIRHEDVDFRTDVFSMGVLLYEMVTGTNFFVAETTTASIARILEADPPSLRSVASNQTQHSAQAAGLDRVITLCLRKPRGDRYQTTMGLVADLEQLQRAAREAAEPAILIANPAGPRPDDGGHIFGRWWWECHQVVVSVVYALTIYPVWHARVWIAKPWSLLLFFVLVAAAATAISIRLHLFFTSRSYPSELRVQRSRSRAWTSASDAVVAAALLVTALAIGGDHAEIAALLLAVSVATTISMLIIEPATARAAFRDG